MKRLIVSAQLIVLTGHLMSSAAAADDAIDATPPSTDISAKNAQATDTEQSTGLQEIVVTAQKRSENLQHVPIAVTAITSDQFDAAGISSGVDLPHLTPNLAITAGQGSFSPFLRGVGAGYPTLGTESSVAVYFDDQYMANPSAGLASFNDIARIEVLMGPQGTLFGRNAAGGAIRIISNDPVHEFEANGSVTYGSYNRITAEGVLNVPISSTVDGRIAIEHDQRQGYVQNTDPSKPVLGGRNITSVRGKLLFQPSDNFKIRVSADTSKKDDFETGIFINLYGAPEQYGVAAGGRASPGFYVTTEDEPYNDDQGYLIDQSGASVRMDWDLGSFTATSISGWRYADFWSQAPGGQVELLHPWPGQNPPPMRRGEGCLRVSVMLGKPCSGFFEAPTLAFELQKVAMVHQPIEQRCYDDDIAEHGREPLNSIE